MIMQYNLLLIHILIDHIVSSNRQHSRDRGLFARGLYWDSFGSVKYKKNKTKRRVNKPKRIKEFCFMPVFSFFSLIHPMKILHIVLFMLPTYIFCVCCF